MPSSHHADEGFELLPPTFAAVGFDLLPPALAEGAGRIAHLLFRPTRPRPPRPVPTTSTAVAAERPASPGPRDGLEPKPDQHECAGSGACDSSAAFAVEDAKHTKRPGSTRTQRHRVRRVTTRPRALRVRILHDDLPPKKGSNR